MKEDGDDDGGRRMAEKNAKQKENQVEIFPCQICVCVGSGHNKSPWAPLSRVGLCQAPR